MSYDIRNIEQVYLNGKKKTIFQVWKYQHNTDLNLSHSYWVFSHNAIIAGWYKKKETIKRKCFN